MLGVDNGATNPATSENVVYPAGTVLEIATDSTLAYDSSGRLWLAWYGSPVTGPGGIYLLQLDPATGATVPLGTPQLAPDSASASNDGPVKLACNSICHVVDSPGKSTTQIVSWAPGQSAPVTLVNLTTPHAFLSPLAAAAAPDGQVWVVYEQATGTQTTTSSALSAVADVEIDARLGDDNGAGGTPTVVPPAVAGAFAYNGSALPPRRASCSPLTGSPPPPRPAAACGPLSCANPDRRSVDAPATWPPLPGDPTVGCRSRPRPSPCRNVSGLMRAARCQLIGLTRRSTV